MTLTEKQVEQLQLLQICPIELRKQLLENIDNECIKAICECCHNTLQGNIPLTAQQKEQLSVHKTILRKLSKRTVPLKEKREIITQKGGFLNILIPTVLSLITSLFHGSS